MQDNKYITIQGWMVSELKLKGSELICYAIIYGFSQDDKSVFSGSASYIAEWLSIDRRNVLEVLKRLTSKGLIVKIEKEVNGVKLCDYKTSQGVMKHHRGSDETSQGGGDETSHHNIDIDNIEEKEINNNKLLFTKKKSKYSIQDIKYYWLPIANKWKLPTVETWSDKRNSELTARLKDLDLDIETFFTKLGDLIAVSPFLRGKRWTHDPDGKSRLEDGEWRGSIDFFLSPSGCSKTFEGKYSERSFLNRDGTVPHFNYERGDKC